MSEKGFKVTGIDFSKKLIEIARREAPAVEFQVMDINQLHFEASFFDGIWASASLLHIPKENILSILKKIHSLLKPHGYFYLSVKQGLGEGVENDIRYGLIEKFWSYFEEDEVKQYLISAEFNILKCSVKGIESSYQTHPWIKLLCNKKNSVQK
jgi:SAM-dependent methyltransferase